MTLQWFEVEQDSDTMQTFTFPTAAPSMENIYNIQIGLISETNRININKVGGPWIYSYSISQITIVNDCWTGIEKLLLIGA